MNEAAYKEELQKTILVFQRMVSDSFFLKQLGAIVACLITSLEESGKILVCGNGGSAAEAQHFVAELVGRYHHNRAAIPALSLTVDTSVLTAIANDYGYQAVFARQVEALGVPGDVLMVLSTSGRSPSIIEALKVAKAKGLITVALLGETLADVDKLADFSLLIPSSETAKIQEAHMTISHLICGQIEKHFIAKNDRKAASFPFPSEVIHDLPLYQL